MTNQVEVQNQPTPIISIAVEYNIAMLLVIGLAVIALAFRKPL